LPAFRRPGSKQNKLVAIVASSLNTASCASLYVARSGLLLQAQHKSPHRGGKAAATSHKQNVVRHC